MSDDIGERFKAYERCFDLARTAAALCMEIQGAVLAYLQSDEISIVARDDMQPNTEPWLGKRLSKMVSLSAAAATAAFNKQAAMIYGEQHFDSRVFVVPDLGEITNYLIWRQQDATRNSLSMAAHAEFPHERLRGVSSNGMLDLLRHAGKPWATPTRFKRGAVCRPVTVTRHSESTGTEVAAPTMAGRHRAADLHPGSWLYRSDISRARIRQIANRPVPGRHPIRFSGTAPVRNCRFLPQACRPSRGVSDMTGKLRPSPESAIEADPTTEGSDDYFRT